MPFPPAWAGGGARRAAAGDPVALSLGRLVRLVLPAVTAGEEIRLEPIDSPAARRLLAGFTAEIAGLYPGWNPSSGPSATAADFEPPRSAFVVAYRDGRAVACAGLKRLTDRAAEIKRVYVAPEARRTGVAGRLLRYLEHHALDSGCAVVRLDTGDRQPAALALFRNAGYHQIADYNGNPYASYWFEKRLRDQDWLAWHRPYDDPASPLSQRLATVRRRITDHLDAAPHGPIRVISVCAGQGRDIIGAARDHPRRPDVTGRLVELDPRLTAMAADAARAADLHTLDVVIGDASTTDAYAGAVPADLVLVCGVFGNVSGEDIAHTIRRIPSLCAPHATVIWTRSRRPPDYTPAMRGWCVDAGLEEVGFDTSEGTEFSVGTYRLARPPDPFEPGVRLFTFVD